MGRVANSLLKIGEDNVTPEVVSLPEPYNKSVEITHDGNYSSCGRRLLDIDCTEKTTDTMQCSSVSSQEIVDTITQSDGFKKEDQDTGSDELSRNTHQTTSKSDEDVNTFDIAVAHAAELEAKWFLNFEQFVAGVQQEPELCQFFAEQNIIDLSGTNVDPILSQYTRTVLTAT